MSFRTKLKGTGDFNNEGKEDLLWLNKTDGANFVWTMNGTTTLTTVQLPAETTLILNICGTGDFNSDRKPDILWRNNTDGSDRIWLMNGTTLVRTETMPVVNPDWEIAGVGDYDGNGKPDIFWRNKVNGKNSVWIMDGLARAGSLNLTQVTNNAWKIEN